MRLNIDPKVDYAFKRLFGSKGRERLLLDLLQAVLGMLRGASITYVEILNPYNEKEAMDDKLSIFDVKVLDSAGRWYNVVMQMVPGKYFRDRILYYGCKLHSQQLREGAVYRDLRDTISICFVNGVIYPDAADYRLFFELRNQGRPELLFSPQLSFYLIELPKFQLAVEALGSSLEKWCYSLRGQE